MVHRKYPPCGQEVGPDVDGLVCELEAAQQAVLDGALGVPVAGDDAVLPEHLWSVGGGFTHTATRGSEMCCFDYKTNKVGIDTPCTEQVQINHVIYIHSTSTQFMLNQHSTNTLFM